MSRSPSFLRRGLLGIACAGALGFGATQALASPQSSAARYFCPTDDNGPYYSETCGIGCPDGIGYCSTRGRCVCGYIP